MTKSKLRRLLDGLICPTIATYAIADAHQSPRAFVAIDQAGRPALLVETSSPATREVVRRGLRLQHRALCFVEIGGATQTITASLVACESDDPNLQQAFISVGEIILSRISNATESEVVAILEELVELLERPGVPSHEAAIGLFAELLVLSLSRNPKHAVRSWRVGANDRFDFVSGAGRIEVKASGTRDRRHTFSLEQCVPEPDTHVFVASTQVLEAAGGMTVRELGDLVKSLVKNDATLVMKVERALISIIGLPRSGEPSFDDEYARTKLGWFDVTQLPAIRSAPNYVDQVRFRINFDALAALSIEEVEILEPTLAACLPEPNTLEFRTD